MSELLRETQLLQAAIRAEIQLSQAVVHDAQEVAAEAAEKAWNEYDHHVWLKRYAP